MLDNLVAGGLVLSGVLAVLWAVWSLARAAAGDGPPWEDDEPDLE